MVVTTAVGCSGVEVDPRSENPEGRRRAIVEERFGRTDPDSLSAHRALAGDPDANVRTAVVDSWAWSRHLQAASWIAGLAGDRSPQVREAVARHLGALDARDQAAVLVGLLKDPDAAVRRTAADALGRVGSTADTEALAAALADDDSAVALAAEEALRRLHKGGPEGRARRVWEAWWKGANPKPEQP